MTRDSLGMRSRRALAIVCLTACSSGTGPSTGGQPHSPNPAERLAVGDFFTCALDHTGVAFCWGVGVDGQLGNGIVAASAIPVRVTGGPYMGITASGNSVCGLRFDGVAECWGVVIPVLVTPTYSLTPTPVSSSVKFAHLSLGYVSACGLTSGGAAYCWGLEDLGSLGDGANSELSQPPVPVAGGHTFTSVSEADRSGCGVDSQGAVWCWGTNLYGALGVGDSSGATVALQPVEVAGGLHYSSVSTGFAYACGITTSHLVQCWGYNAAGQLGDSSAINRDAPTPVADSHFVSVFPGTNGFGAYDDHTCALDASGMASCWGYNGYGQLGGASADSCMVPTRVEAVDCALTPVAVQGGLSFTILAPSRWHTCGMIADGHVYCWGYNGDGELGNGTRADSPTPVLSEFTP